MYDEDEFWNFEVPFENEYLEFFENLKNGIKASTLKEIEDLKAENKRLHEIADDIESVQRNLDRQKADLEIATKQSIKTAKKLALDELLKPAEHVYWDITYSTIKAPKCNLCDDYRRRAYVTPLGRHTTEQCPCDYFKREFTPRPMTLYSLLRRNGELIGYYYMSNSNLGRERLDYYGTFEENGEGSKMVDKTFIKTKEDFPVYERYGSLFATEEICREYCKLLQQKEDSEKPDIGNDVALAPVEIL